MLVLRPRHSGLWNLPAFYFLPLDLSLETHCLQIWLINTGVTFDLAVTPKVAADELFHQPPPRTLTRQSAVPVAVKSCP